MPASEADQFLEAEAHATRLVEELSQLKKEAASHAASSSALEATAAALQGLAGRVEELATGLGETVRAARELGIPGLLEQQENRVGLKITETGTAIEQSVAGSRDHLETKLQQDLGELAQRLAVQLGTIEKSVVGSRDHIESKLLRDLGELAQRLEGQLGATEKRLNAQVGTLKKAVTTYGVAAIVGMVVVGLAVVAVLVKSF